ncbi:MAG: hypothetical protein J6T81_08290 [Bacteroidales bacterium]|nr:hypothetical protein [Bacteroidales bacterium]
MDSFNCILGLNLTSVNTIVTIVSIVLTIITSFLTIKTWRYKKQVFDKINAFDVVTYSRNFHTVYLNISKKIRTTESNKGGRNNNIISELEAILRDFNKYENKLPEENRKSVRANVDSALDKIHCLFEGTADSSTISSFKSRLDDMDRTLIKITEKMLK